MTGIAISAPLHVVLRSARVCLGGTDRADGAEGGQRPLRRFASAARIGLLTPAGIAIEAVVADRFVARLAGLAGVDRERAPALLIPRCGSVHTVWMRFALDVVFLDLPATGAEDAEAVVRSVHTAVPRRRVVSATRGSGAHRSTGRAAALELPAGEAERLALAPGRDVRVTDLHRRE